MLLTVVLILQLYTGWEISTDIPLVRIYFDKSIPNISFNLCFQLRMLLECGPSLCVIKFDFVKQS